MEKTKIGIIGLGTIAQLVHLPNFARINNAEVSAVAEIRKSRLNSIADKFNIKEKYLDYREMLEKSNIDAVIVATPTSSHKEVAIDCLKAKKNVLVEKPLARTYNEARLVITAAKKYKSKLMVGMNLRFRPDAMILKSILSSGEIGEPFYIKCGWIRRPSSSEKWLTQKEESGGGVIIDLGILILDLSLWLLDFPSIESVTTQNFSQFTKNVEDTSVSLLRCKNSSLISLESSWSLPVEKDTFYLNIHAKKGFASINPFRVFKKIGDQIIDLTPSQKENALSLFKKSYENELKSFLGAVRGLNPVVSSGEESLFRMKILESMYNSHKHKLDIKF
jgi:predicted dehydrogenase